MTAAASELALASATMRATCSAGIGLVPARPRIRARSPRAVMASPPAAMIRGGTMGQGDDGSDPYTPRSSSQLATASTAAIRNRVRRRVGVIEAPPRVVQPRQPGYAG